MHTSRTGLPASAIDDRYEAHVVEWGEYTVYFERLAASADVSVYCERCNCPHLGCVFKGRIRFVYDGGQEEVRAAGELYYAPPGHTLQALEETEIVEFSPTAGTVSTWKSSLGRT